MNLDSVLKIVQGWVKIKGASDGTFIGNVGDALKVTAVLAPASDEVTLNTYAEVTSVPSSTLTTIVSFTVPVAKTFFVTLVEVSGSNIAEYRVEIDAVTQAKRRTFFGGPFNELFPFGTEDGKGLKLIAGQVIRARVIHTRPTTGDFEARILGVQKG